MKKLTITLEDSVYNGLYAVVGSRKISRLLNDLARSYITDRELLDGYKAMAADEEYEAEANEWIDGTLPDAGRRMTGLQDEWV